MYTGNREEHNRHVRHCQTRIYQTLALLQKVTHTHLLTSRDTAALRHVPHSKPVKPMNISLLSEARRWIGLAGIDSFMVTEEGGELYKQALDDDGCGRAGRGWRERGWLTQTERSGDRHAGGDERWEGREGLERWALSLWPTATHTHPLDWPFRMCRWMGPMAQLDPQPPEAERPQTRPGGDKLTPEWVHPASQSGNGQ